jgi:P-type Cu+ transporter
MAEHVRFPIEGMTCTSCVARITRSVRKLEGVASVKVDLATGSATVAYDPAQTSLVAVGEAVERAGYKPRLSEAEPWIAQRRLGWFTRLGL